MLLKEIKIGKFTTPNNLFLAPLAGYTNAPFRQMCFSLGAGLTCTEMVSAKGLCYDSDKTVGLLRLPTEYSGINAVQLFGSDPEFMRRAACGEELKGFDIIDLNFGCPVPKIFKNGEGSALLNDIPLAEKLVKACLESGKAVTAKFRIGVDENHIVAVEFAKAMEGAGASLITVHGRTRDKMYSGEVNFCLIEKVVRAVNIPVIANGGVFTADDADVLMKNTGADGVMVARGAMYDPFIFAKITGKNYNARAAVTKQIEETYAAYGDRFATVFMRKMLGFYIKGKAGAAALRVKLLQAQSKRELIELFNDLDF